MDIAFVYVDEMEVKRIIEIGNTAFAKVVIRQGECAVNIIVPIHVLLRFLSNTERFIKHSGELLKMEKGEIGNE